MSHTPRWVYGLRDALPAAATSPADLLGGKGASLRTLAEAGVRVPAGFTITTAACRQYFALARRWPDGLMTQVQAAVERLERECGRAYGLPPAPLLLAVRSGAAVSLPGMLLTVLDCGVSAALAEALPDLRLWDRYADFLRRLAAAQGVELPSIAAGSPPDQAAACHRLLESYLRARGEPFPQDRWELLRQAITAVFDSWQSPQAVALREACGADHEAGTAVTVQVMQPTEVAGVLFSRDPLGGDSDQLFIEAVAGSGQRLVEGSATPQRITVSRKASLAPRTSHRAPSTLLSEAQVHELTRLGVDVEERFGAAIDIEWGYSGGELVVFQARPQAAPAASAEALWAGESQRLQRQAAARGTGLWVRHNLAESLPAPTPLTWDIVQWWMSGRGGLGRLYRELGYRPSPRVWRDGFLDLLAGQIYADPGRVAEMFCGGLPLGFAADELRADPGLIDRAPTHFMPERTDALFLLRVPAMSWTLWRSARRLKRELPHAAERFEQHALPAFRAYVQAERQCDLQTLGDSELIARLEQRRARVLDEFAAESLRPGLFGALAFAEMERRLTEVLGSDEGCRLGRELTSGLEAGTNETPQEMLYRVAMGERSVGEFLERFGHRGPREMELSAPRWRETPERVALVAEQLRAARPPASLRAEAARRRAEAAETLPQRLREAGAGSLFPQVERQWQFAQRLLPYREIGRDCLMLGYELIRQAIEELARRFGLGQGIYFWRWDEVQGLPRDPGPRPDAIAARRREWLVLQRLSLPDVIEVRQLDRLGPTVEPSISDDAETWPGTSLSNGVAQGPVQILSPAAAAPASIARPGTPRPILVCPALDPGLAPLLLQAAGLIVERGGVLSHGAIVARQLGLPAVAVGGAASLLRDGDFVVVDGDRGAVLRQRRPS